MKNKKKMLVLTAIALIITAIGGTYAWWTATVESKQQVSMGKLRIEADFPEILDTTDWEPGLQVEMPGTITNTGSIATIAKIENSSQIRFVYSDDDLTIIPEADRSFVADDDGAIDVTFGPGENDSDVYWFIDNRDGTTVYALFEIGGKVESEITAEFDGEIMGNKYQGSRINIGAKLRATQVLEGAMKTEFNGLTLDDLDGFPEDTEDDTRRSTGSPTKGELRLKELLNRGKK